MLIRNDMYLFLDTYLVESHLLKKLEDTPRVVEGIMKKLEWNWVEMMYMDSLQLELKISRMTWLFVGDDLNIVSWEWRGWIAC